MTINNLPAAIQQIVQDGWLLRFFDEALYPALMYRGIFEAMEVPQHLGQTYTFTKKGLLPVVQTAMTPPANTDNTSGLTPVTNSYEQYSVVLNQYAQPVQTNMVSSGISIVDLYKENVEDLGYSAGRSLDTQARRALFQAYAGGRTYLTAGSSTTSIAVKDVNGFDFVYVNGLRVTTSVSNPHPVTLTENGTPDTRNVTGVTPGALNTDTDRIPGTLTLDVAVTGAIVGDYVISDYAPVSLRPNGKTTSFNLAANDTLTMSLLNSATKNLMALGVPPHDDTFYHAYLTPDQIQQLQDDGAIQKIYETHPDSEEFQRGAVAIVANCKIFMTNAAPNDTNEAGVSVQRGMVTGKKLGFEVRSSLIAEWLNASGISANGHIEFSPTHHIAMVLLKPQDYLQQVVTNTWSFIGNWVAATDVYGGVGASTRYYRRAVMVETAGS